MWVAVVLQGLCEFASQLDMFLVNVFGTDASVFQDAKNLERGRKLM
jgi:hypothetical protein